MTAARRRTATVLRTAAAALLLAAEAVHAQSILRPGAPEARLAGIFQAMESGSLDTALKRVDQLIALHPNFRLGHLIRGDLLLARARPLPAFGSAPKIVPQDRLEELRAEARVRVRAIRERPATDAVPRNLVELRPDQSHAIVVDSSRSRLYVFENVDGLPRYLADYYVTLGKNGIDKLREGDQKTPTGIYVVTGNLPRQKLPDFYGSGAFPINYPNELDRQAGRSGSGIWVHGTPSFTYSRAPLASDGCIVLANPDLEAVAPYLQAGRTPVIIVTSIDWTDAEQLASERHGLRAALDTWRKDWESRDMGRYLAHYAAAFRSSDQDLAAWSAHKQKVNASKEWITVGINAVGMFRYPGRDGVVEVTFNQNYASNNLANVMRKRQHWVRAGGKWKIVYEGTG